MNSVIISAIGSFMKKIKDKFLQSVVCGWLLNIYNLFSNAWNKSILVDIVGNTSRKEKVSESLIYKVFNIPFVFLEFIKSKIGNFIDEKIKKSIICHFGRVYIHNIMALNIRFLGIIILTAGITYEAIKLIRGTYSLYVVAATIVGAVMLVFNYNITSAFDSSKFVSLVKSFLGFKDIKFDFYNSEAIETKARIIVGIIVGAVMGLVAVYSPLYAILVPFALFGMILVLYAPITGVYAAVFLGALIPTMLLAGICLWTTFSLVIKGITTKEFKWRMEGTGVGLLLLLLLLFVSSVFSFAPVKSLTVWAMYLVFITFFFTVINAVETKEQLYGIIKVLIISGALVALYGVMQYLFGWTTANAWIDETMFQEQTMRVYSTLGNPNVLGEFLILVLPLAFVQCIKNSMKTLAKYGYIAMAGILLLCLVLTQSRGCWLGFFLSIAIFITFWQGKIWGIVPVVICILPFVIPQTIVDRLLSIGNMSDSSTSYRVFIWLGTMQLLKFFWLAGIGMGEAAFAEVYPIYSYNAIVAPHSHNTFLQLTVEAGIGALVIFVVTQFVFIKSTVRVYRGNSKNSLESLNALAIGCSVLAFLLQSMFDYTFYNYRVMALFFMVMAIGILFRYVSTSNMSIEGE